MKEVRAIMDQTGFKARLESLGSWGGHRPDDERSGARSAR